MVVKSKYYRCWILLGIVILFLVPNISYAVIAYPYGVKLPLADGKVVTIFLKGDEYSKWAESEDGYTLLRNTEGNWCYAERSATGELKPSEWIIGTLSERSPQLFAFLRQIPKKLPVIAENVQRRSMRSARVHSMPSSVTGKQKTLVILMQFKNASFKKSQTDFDALFNQADYIDDGAKGSVRDFYLENSSGILDLNCDVIGPFTSSEEMEYYGGNDIAGNDMRPEELFMEALNIASSQVRLADYDADKDGFINNIHLIYAGYGEEAGASASAIWAHEAVYRQPITEQGMKIAGYSCAPELRGNRGTGISRIGVHCHEIGHSFGALDFYDTNYERDGEFEGTGKWDLMASGSWNEEGISPAHFNPYIKAYTFGWMACETLTKEDNSLVLSPVTSANQILRIETSTAGEYFLLENRQQAGFDRSLPGSGLMIYHIHSQIEKGFDRNIVNATYPQMCYPVCATAPSAIPNKNASSYGNINSSSCPYPGSSGKTEFTASTIPAACSWDGDNLGIRLTGITQLANGNISCKVEKEEAGVTEKLLFSDGFENGFSFWILSQLSGTTCWNVYINTSLGGTVSSMPDAVEGSSYLYMKSTKNSSFTHSCRLSSPPIDLSKAQHAVLSFSCQNLSANMKRGILHIQYRTSPSGDWKHLQSIPEEITKWKEYTVKLPNISEQYQIAFESELITGTILLDDVKVYSDVATSVSQIEKEKPVACYAGKGSVRVLSDTNRSFKIYGLSGRILMSCDLKPGMNTIQVPAGFYVGKYDQGAIKFCVY